jgi:tRNA-dihydrouridine synthase
VHGRTRAQGFSGAAAHEPIAAVRAALPAEVPVVGNGDVKDLAGYTRMRAATGCDAVMIGRGAMGNPWLFAAVAALEARGEAAPPPPPSIEERHRVWRRHADLVLAYAPSRMRIHELRKTLAWYSRGLHGGSHLRQQSGAPTSPEALLDAGEAFFAGLHRLSAAHGGDGGAAAALLTAPADPVAKAIARNGRRSGPDPIEAEEPCLAAVAAAS